MFAILLLAVWCDHLFPFAWPPEIVGSLLLSLLPRDTWCLDHVLISLPLLCSPMVDDLHCDKAFQKQFVHEVCSQQSVLVSASTAAALYVPIWGVSLLADGFMP